MPSPVDVPRLPSAPRALRLGFIALTDAAPLIVAQELGLFSRFGVRVELRREIGWATIREKIIYGELDAAHAPAPMLWSTQLGLGCPACDVLTAQILNVHGNAITLSRALHIRERVDLSALSALTTGEKVPDAQALQALDLSFMGFLKGLVPQSLIEPFATNNVLSVVLVLGNILKELLNKLINENVPLEVVLAFMAVVLPFSLTFSIPWGLLTALLLVLVSSNQSAL